MLVYNEIILNENREDEACCSECCCKNIQKKMKEKDHVLSSDCLPQVCYNSVMFNLHARVAGSVQGKGKEKSMFSLNNKLTFFLTLKDMFKFLL